MPKGKCILYHGSLLLIPLSTRQYRMGGRLCLDEAVKQAQKHQEEDPEKAFEGWSEARIRAYQMINENPNSYYYRFNAPGEVQRRGQWSKVSELYALFS